MKPSGITPVLSIARKASSKSSWSKWTLKAKANHLMLTRSFCLKHHLEHEYTGTASSLILLYATIQNLLLTPVPPKCEIHMAMWQSVDEFQVCDICNESDNENSNYWQQLISSSWYFNQISGTHPPSLGVDPNPNKVLTQTLNLTPGRTCPETMISQFSLENNGLLVLECAWYKMPTPSKLKKYVSQPFKEKM